MPERVRIFCALAGLLLLSLPPRAVAQEPGTCGNSSEQVVIDVEELGAILSEAVGDIATVLKDLQVEVRLGQDNRLDLSVQDRTYELDLDEILRQVGTALEVGLGELETQDWTSVTVRGDRDATAEELREELDGLRRELQELQAELGKLRERD